MPVRKHRAPKGALRPIKARLTQADSHRTVRKHRAPKGALRRQREEERECTEVITSESTERQKVH